MSYWSSTYKRYGPEILAFLRRRLWGQDETAEDLCQETFARVMTARLREPSSVRAYLFRTANNLLINHIQRGSGAFVDHEADVGAELARRPDPRTTDPYQAAEHAQVRDQIQTLLTQLPADQRTAFEKGVIDGLPYAQIAEEQSWTVTKVKICVYRARKSLMAGLAEYR